MFREAGFEARIVGGAVRDALIGRGGGDLDFATSATAHEVMKIAGNAGVGCYPTGISHGTVTVVLDGAPMQITTLRRDVETDGRHAVIAHTGSWVEDAARRDFTINALYCDEDGRMYDYFGGLADLAHRRVRFIGDATTRIREDYLRILRLFRFSSLFAGGEVDPDALAAAHAERAGITRLSAERIRDELLKLLVSPDAAALIALMHRHDILAQFLAPAFPERLARLCGIEAALGEVPDALSRLLALAVSAPIDASQIADRLRLSAAQASALEMGAAGAAAMSLSSRLPAARAYIFRNGAVAYGRAVKQAWVRSDATVNDASWRARRLLPDRFQPPTLPVSGRDVIALGIPAGPVVGDILAAFETWWLDEGCPTDKERALAKLSALALMLKKK